MHLFVGAVLVNHFEWDVLPHPLSGGWRHMNDAALSLKRAAQRFGWWCGRGRGPHFAVFVLWCWADSAQIPHWRLPFWGNFWELLVQIHLLCLCMEVRMFWLGFLPAIWEAGTVPSSLSTPHLISGWWSVASSGLLRLCLGAFTRTQWLNLKWTTWRARRFGSGSTRLALGRAIITNDLSIPGLVDVVANKVGVWPLVVSYLKVTGRKDDGESLVVMSSFLRWNGLQLYSVEVVILLFRRRTSTGIFTTISLLAWTSGCLIFFWKPVSAIVRFLLPILVDT